MKKDCETIKLLAFNLRRLRNKLNISQLELSGLTGLSVTFINNIEHERKWVSAKTLKLLSSALKVYPHDFFLPKDFNLKELESKLLEYNRSVLLDLNNILKKYHME